ncbi:inositol monophosphatase [Microvirga tunisiensis]|uniref:Inositol-1-monophosphatase n=2 Tax=Pannonibacter tanglangensis TaxID=2750084 RepID=A0A7X5F4U0_9HYPH|nr:MULTISPECIES: inositol monophosphatase family protein [unclassified Pannonibacter]NBN65260.1 inositol monophosphatase [Pannonibacter sp. XCT-34]NBN79763.1 inositol monophosphatase [Pannonibacter sp. XCT-53]
MARTALLNVMVQAAMKAGRALVRDFGEVENLQVSRKGPSDFVSAADRRAEEIIRAELSKARPAFGFLMEEGGEIPAEDGQHRWIVDPLDGTTNFLHGIPLFAISIALERQGQIVAGVIFNPVMDELYTCERGRGVFLNDRRLRVANRNALPDCLIGTGLPFLGKGDHGRALKELRHVMPEVAGIRRCGAAALDLAFVAAGRLDGFWEHSLNPWDIAAGLLMVREAGGFVSDINGKDTMLETGSIVAGNEFVRAQLLKLLKNAAE